MPEGGKKKLPEGLGVGGFHTHEPLGGGRKDGTQGGLGVTRREGEAIFLPQAFQGISPPEQDGGAQ